MPLNAKLVVVGGDVKTAEIHLRLPSTIGRGRGTTIMLPHPLVSRQHCELYESNGQLMVRDLGSLNGTFVNNERISEAPLPPGELLTVGTVTFRAVYDSDAAVSTAAGPWHGESGNGAGPAGETPRAGTAVKALPAAQSHADDLDFGHPPTPVEDDLPARPTQRQEGSGAFQTTIAEPSSPAPSASPLPPGESDETVDVSSFPQEDEEVAAEGDDDLEEFLKNLEK